MRLTIAFASFPETRSTAIAPSPTGVEIAAIVSSRVIGISKTQIMRIDFRKRAPIWAKPQTPQSLRRGQLYRVPLTHRSGAPKRSDGGLIRSPPSHQSQLNMPADRDRYGGQVSGIGLSHSQPYQRGVVCVLTQSRRIPIGRTWLKPGARYTIENGNTLHAPGPPSLPHSARTASRSAKNLRF